MFFSLYKHQWNTKPFHVYLIVFWCVIFTCQDIKFSGRKLTWYFIGVYIIKMFILSEKKKRDQNRVLQLNNLHHIHAACHGESVHVYLYTGKRILKHHPNYHSREPKEKKTVNNVTTATMGFLFRGFFKMIILPFPLVWSPEGPVPEDNVGPFFRVQSNLSFLSCRKPHIEASKLHVLAKRVKQANITRYIRSSWYYKWRTFIPSHSLSVNLQVIN